MEYHTHPTAGIIRQAMRCPNCGKQGELTYFRDFTLQQFRGKKYLKKADGHYYYKTCWQNAFVGCGCVLPNDENCRVIRFRRGFYSIDSTMTETAHIQMIFANETRFHHPKWLLRSHDENRP